MTAYALGEKAAQAGELAAESLETTYTKNTPNANFSEGISFPKALHFLIEKPIWAVFEIYDILDEKTGKITTKKMPLSPKTEGAAKIDDPSTWGTYAEAAILISPRRQNSNKKRHLAIALQKDLGLLFIDLDKVRDPSTGMIEPWAQDIIDLAGSYAEISQSGKGVHILGTGKKGFDGCRKDQIELYDDSRFCIVTGHPIDPDSTTLENIETAFETIAEQYGIKKKETEKKPSAPSQIHYLADDGLIEKARSAKNGASFSSLFDAGNLSEHGDDHSSADLALLQMLVFWTQDPAQLDRLFRRSALNREKWESRADYRERTIAKALSGQTEFYKDHNAFKIELKNGFEQLTPSIKKELKTSAKCSWNKPLRCWTGPIENIDIARGIIGDRGDISAAYIENIPKTTTQQTAQALWNKIDTEEVKLREDEGAFRVEIDRAGYSESYFLEAPAGEGKEREFYARYQDILLRREEVENMRRSAAEFDKEEETQDNGFLVEPGKTHLAAQKGKAILSDSNCGVFQRIGQTVRIVRYAKGAQLKKNPIERQEGAFIISEADETFLVKTLSERAKWEKFDKRTQKPEPIDFPDKAARFILTERGDGLPILTGFVCAPTLRADGSLLENPGYDPESGLFFDHCGTKFPSIPQKPSKEDAVKSLELLKDLLKDFRFDGDVSKSVAISELMTSPVRRSLDVSPAYGNNAPEMGSGKSLLADLAGILATGNRCTCVSPAKGEEETRKRLASALLGGDAVICIDNVSDPFYSDAMCTILTSPYWQERLLGTNTSVQIPTNSLFIFTGNNLSFKGDMCSRVVMCNIDPQTEKPGERKFDRDLKEYALAHRGELVAAVLTIIRAYIVAECPDQNLPTFRLFSDWSRWIRSPLVWLGMPDPYESTRLVTDNDPIRNELGALFSAWHEALKSLPIESVTLKRLLEFVKTPPPQIEDHSSIKTLQDALLEFAPDGKGGVDSRLLGNKIRQCKGRIVGGYRLEAVGEDRNKVVLWKIVKTSKCGV